MNNDQFAFPRYGGSLGMSLLDYFAANAMVMLLTDNDVGEAVSEENADLYAVVAAMSYDMAEAMVKERDSRYGE